MSLKLCPKCRKPFLAASGTCPHCPEPANWDQENWANLGCLLVTLLPLLGMMLFWLFMFLGLFFR